MTDLDELRRAASEARTRPINGGTGSRRRPRVTIAVALSCVAAGVAAAAWVMRGRTVQTTFTAPGTPMSFTVSPAPEARTDPGFTITSLYQAGASAWEVTNERQEPLVVQKITINGEFVAPLATKQPLLWKEPKKAPPVTLTIGERCAFLESHPSWAVESYQKKVIFLDIDTSRGKFRYRPGSGFEAH